VAGKEKTSEKQEVDVNSSGDFLVFPAEFEFYFLTTVE
jgi:hypothetical protein